MTPDERQPLVSVVTPFFNSAVDLTQCIESVLSQSYARFEYVLVDNCSTDNSLEIARAFAARDPRIRLVEAKEFRGQVENYNYALSLISTNSVYCKLVQADDWIYPSCLAEMVDVATRFPSVGLVAAYSLRGTSLRGEGLEVHQNHVRGRDAGRKQLLDHIFLTGSPTTIMYRSDLVRSRSPFYELGRYHEDTEVAYEILRGHDLGFVHQVLSYQRVDEASIMGKRSSYMPHLLDRLIILDRFGKDFLSPVELERERKHSESELIGFLGKCLLRGRQPDFWKYQRGGFALMGRPWPKFRVLISALNQLLDVLLNPKHALQLIFSRLRR